MLAPGNHLGPYVVQALIGVGGMGEVYRARDTLLNRDVALKVLPSTLCVDAERVARFHREAQILASLNHPHIAAIYGVHEEAASEPGASPVQALVLELVEGQTLAERIMRGPLPTEQALGVARQIATALDAAHEHGVVHRDLKPANVKVRDDGTVKLLDFGLAKALVATAPTGAPGVTSPATTRLGVVLGTDAYMSPEQARGLPADKRTDIWAFGCVLYEMLTGKRTFEGEHSSDTMAAVLRGEPDWSALPRDVPASVSVLLRRCLSKDRSRRLRDIGDAQLDLDDAPARTAEPSPARAPARSNLAWGLAGLVAGVAAALGWGSLRTTEPAPEMRVELNTPTALDPFSIALSPDGRAIAFVAAGDGAPRLWLRRLNESVATPLPATELAQYPFWSPDGRSIAFFSNGELKRIDIDGGGAPRVLAPAVPGGGGAWGPDGEILFAPTLGAQLFRVPASGGPTAPVTEVDQTRGQNGHRFPQFLPDGRHFIFFGFGAAGSRGIHIGSLDEPGQARWVTAADAAGLYVDPGWLLFMQQGVLLARRFDVVRAELAGDPIVLAEGISTNEATARSFAASANGLLAFSASQTPSRLTWFDRSGRTLGTLGTLEDDDLLDPEISPDGTRVAVTRTQQANADVWIFDEARGARFTLETSNERYPTWSPDGRELLFNSDRNGPLDLYVGSATAPGRERSVLVSADRKFPTDWAPDGASVLYFNVGDSVSSATTRVDLWVMPVRGVDPEARPWLATPASELWAQFSPNGQYVAYHSNESGRLQEVYVRRFAQPEERWPISTAGGVYPRWSNDGNELYYVAPDHTLMAVPIKMDATELIAGVPQPLFQRRIVGGGRNVIGRRQQYDVGPDGRFLVNVESDDAPAPSITLVLNWKAE